MYVRAAFFRLCETNCLTPLTKSKFSCIRAGGADIFLDRSNGVSKLSPVLVGAQPAQRALEAPLAIVAKIAVQAARELLGADPAPVAVVEELGSSGARRTPPWPRCRGCRPSSTSSGLCRFPRIGLSIRASGSDRPWSEWTTVGPVRRLLAIASRSVAFASPALGLPPILQATGRPSKQSIIALR